MTSSPFRVMRWAGVSGYLMRAGDGPAFTAALKKISARMPEFLESTAMEEVLADEMVRALLGGRSDAGGKCAADHWQGNGLPPADQIPAEMSRGKIRAGDAEQRLNKGEAIISDKGEVVGFTSAILDHWRNDEPKIQPQEERRRLMGLEDAPDAVRNPHEVWETRGRHGAQRA